MIFPNTVPPFYEKAYHVSPLARPEQYERWLAGTRAHNRWLADFCAEEPQRRAGIGLIHLNDIDDAIEDVQWIAEHGLRGGVLLPLPALDDVHLEQLTSPHYDRLWAAIQDHDLVINQHSGQGSPRYARRRGRPDAVGARDAVLRAARLLPADPLRCLRALPAPALHPDRVGLCLGAGPAEADGRRPHGHEGRHDGRGGHVEVEPLAETPTFYARRNCWYGASFPSPADVKGRDYVGVDRILWGNDYPHYEGCYPYSRENMRLAYADVDEKEVRMMLGENAANALRLRPRGAAPGRGEARHHAVDWCASRSTRSPPTRCARRSSARATSGCSQEADVVGLRAQRA